MNATLIEKGKGDYEKLKLSQHSSRESGMARERGGWAGRLGEGREKVTNHPPYDL